MKQYHIDLTDNKAERECPNCNGVGKTEVSNTVIVCCVCKGSGKCPSSCFECKYHLYDFSGGEVGCIIKNKEEEYKKRVKEQERIAKELIRALNIARPDVLDCTGLTDNSEDEIK